MVAASRAQHSPVILLLQRMRHKARVRVVASKQCASGSTLLCDRWAQGDGGDDGDGDGDGDRDGEGDGDVGGQTDSRVTRVCLATK